jgi:hypothetical protein
MPMASSVRFIAPGFNHNAPGVLKGNQKRFWRDPALRARQVEATPWFNRQGQAHIVSTAIRLPRSCKAGREVEATPWFRTWFSIDPQPASISPTINISIVFICAFLVDCGRIIRHPAIKNDSSAILNADRAIFRNLVKRSALQGGEQKKCHEYVTGQR